MHSKDALKLSITDGGRTLTLSGEQQYTRTVEPDDKQTAVARSNGKNAEQPTTWLRERFAGSFARSVRFATVR